MIHNCVPNYHLVSLAYKGKVQCKVGKYSTNLAECVAVHISVYCACVLVFASVADVCDQVPR